MKVCVLLGSPRLNGNTAELLKPFVDELTQNEVAVEYITLTDKNIKACKGCYACQNVSERYGCVHDDDGTRIMETIISSDCVVLATPIYSWYCTSPMKALLDRHYGLNKFYGSATGSLWKGKSVAIIATHGYDAEYGAGPFETGIKRLCAHSHLNYRGMYSVQDDNDKASFQTEEAILGARAFAKMIMTSK